MARGNSYAIGSGDGALSDIFASDTGVEGRVGA